MRVVWTDEATSHLDGIYAFIALTSPIYARRLIDKLVSRADDLGDFPTMGRVLTKYNDPSIRELVVAPYTIVYLIQPDSILVLTVIHGARDQRE
jgi:toxin ParE1/3/4